MKPDIVVTKDQRLIRHLGKEIVVYGLYVPGWTAKEIFEGCDRIHVLAYLPGIAWCMHHEMSKWRTRARYSAFTRPDCRRQGIMNNLYKIAQAAFVADQQEAT